MSAKRLSSNETPVRRGPHASSPDPAVPASHSSLDRKDAFTASGVREYAGVHLLIDFWDAQHLDDLERMKRVLREAVAASGATLLHVHVHRFTPTGGISGVAVLAESHISVHTWPERGFAAFDVFMCGHARPEAATAILERNFRPGRVRIHRHLRGGVDGDA